MQRRDKSNLKGLDAVVVAAGACMAEVTGAASTLCTANLKAAVAALDAVGHAGAGEGHGSWKSTLSKGKSAWPDIMTAAAEKLLSRDYALALKKAFASANEDRGSSLPDIACTQVWWGGSIILFYLMQERRRLRRESLG